MADELPVFVAWLDFVSWILPTTAGFPHRVRFTLAQRIDSLVLDVVEDLVEARYSRRRLDVLRRANLRLEKLRVLLRLSFQQRHLAHRQYEHASRALVEVGSMLGGWQRYERRR
jgi:hypothetical protein